MKNFPAQKKTRRTTTGWFFWYKTTNIFSQVKNEALGCLLLLHNQDGPVSVIYNFPADASY